MVAKLEVMCCVVKNVFAIGWDAKKLSNVVGFFASGPLAPMANNSSRNSSEVAVGKPLKLWQIISAVVLSGMMNFIPSPRGLAAGLLSGMVGIPVKSENRSNTLLDWLCKKEAFVISAASLFGTKVP